MAGDTLRGIGKKEIAEALESSPEAVPERATESNGSVQARDATADIDIEEGRPVRSLDQLPSERTGRPGVADVAGVAHVAGVAGVDPAVTMLGGLAAPVPIAPDIAPDVAPDLAPGPAPALTRELAPSPLADLPAELVGELPYQATTATPVQVDDAVPLGTRPTPRSGPNRVSFGTVIGHEMHAVQARVAAALAEADSSARGTAHGRDVHLPASPGMTVNPEPVALAVSIPAVEALAAISGTSPGSAAVAAPIVREPAATSSRDALNEFSGGDHSFFEAAPVNDEYEPENPRGRLYTRLAIAGAVLAVVSVVVVAWVNSHGGGEEPPPIEIKTAARPPGPRPVVPATRPPVAPVAPVSPPAPAPAPVAAAPARSKEPPPTSTIPSSIPDVVPPPPVAATPPAPVRIAKAASRVAVSEPKAPAVAPPAAAREDRKPAPPSASSAPASAGRDQKPAVTPAKAADEPAPTLARDKKPAAVATRPAEAAHVPPPHPREVAHPPAPAPATKVASSPAARAPRPETPARPIAKPATPSPARAQRGIPVRGKGKYDPDGTLPLSFD
ncbi:MAG TPA: hypothetical protein VFH68_08700 [Polyangia bacterium]|nr:hypothetical protein [Polyangia bacterium]